MLEIWDEIFITRWWQKLTSFLPHSHYIVGIKPLVRLHHRAFSCVCTNRIYLVPSGSLYTNRSPIVPPEAKRHTHRDIIDARFCRQPVQLDQSWEYIDGLVQDCSISIAKAFEILQSWTKPSIWSHFRTWLTHWGRVTHICVGNLAIIGSDNGLSPGRRQAIIWTNDGMLLIGPLGTNFSEISIEIQTFSFKIMRLKVSSAKRRPFCLGLNVLLTHVWLGPTLFADNKTRMLSDHLMSCRRTITMTS